MFNSGRPHGLQLPGFSIHGILQARILEWVAISFSNAWKWKVKVKSLSRVWLLATPWTAAHQAPPSMGFSRQEYWSGVPLPSPIRADNLAINSCFCHLLAVWPCRSHLISLCFSLLIRYVGMEGVECLHLVDQLWRINLHKTNQLLTTMPRTWSKWWKMFNYMIPCIKNVQNRQIFRDRI